MSPISPTTSLHDARNRLPSKRPITSRSLSCPGWPSMWDSRPLRRSMALARQRLTMIFKIWECVQPPFLSFTPDINYLMQIKTQLRPAVNNEQSLPLHAALSAVPPSRRKPSADEQFLEQNAWANPLHPAHQHLQELAQQQQAAHQSHISNSLITPVTQRRTIDRSGLKGSASTIPDENSVLSSSAAATPVSITQSQNRQPSGKGVITEPFPSLTHTKSNLSSHNALALAEGDRSPTDTRRRVQDHGVLERPLVAQGLPGLVQQGTAPASRSIFSAVLNKQSAASHPGLFTEQLGLNPSTSPSSAVKSNEVPDNPHSSPPVSHLQHLQGSITAGTGLGRFASR